MTEDAERLKFERQYHVATLQRVHAAYGNSGTFSGHDLSNEHFAVLDAERTVAWYDSKLADTQQERAQAKQLWNRLNHEVNNLTKMRDPSITLSMDEENPYKDEENEP